MLEKFNSLMEKCDVYVVALLLGCNPTIMDWMNW